VSLTLFLPICLEQFARDNGFLLPEKEVPCSGLKSDIQNGTATPGIPADAVRCVVKIGWAWIDTASFRYVVLNDSCTVANN
jgi:UMF1 family MFS transporter